MIVFSPSITCCFSWCDSIPAARAPVTTPLTAPPPRPRPENRGTRLFPERRRLRHPPTVRAAASSPSWHWVFPRGRARRAPPGRDWADDAKGTRRLCPISGNFPNNITVAGRAAGERRHRPGKRPRVPVTGSSPPHIQRPQFPRRLPRCPLRAGREPVRSWKGLTLPAHPPAALAPNGLRCGSAKPRGEATQHGTGPRASRDPPGSRRVALPRLKHL